jgi:Flp pilus assembly protein CpaB
MFRLRRDKFELLTLILGVGAIIGFFLYIRNDRQRIDILVTNVPLEPGMAVSASNLRSVPWHPGFMLKDMIQAKDEQKVLGAMVVQRIAKDEPLRAGYLASPDDNSSTNGLTFSDRVSSTIKDPEMRLLSWPLDQTGVLNGRVKAGDFIDIILTIKDPQSKSEFTKTLRQGVKVVAITDKDMLFMLPLQEVEAFVFAKNAGTVSFALAAPHPKEVTATGVNYQILYDRWLRGSPGEPVPTAEASTTPTPVGVGAVPTVPPTSTQQLYPPVAPTPIPTLRVVSPR